MHDVVNAGRPPRLEAWERPAWIALLAGAALVRLWNLGARVMSHDESLHAYYSYELFTRGIYRHDPTYHGPLLYHLNAVVYALFGASDLTARLVPALLGVAVVGSVWLLRHYVGRRAALIGGALIAISPTFVFYSRHIREDIYVVLFTMLWMYAAFEYLRDGSRRWLYILTTAMALAFLSKETSFMFGVIIGAFAVVLRFSGFGSIDASRRQAAGDLAVLMFTLALPFISGLAYFVVGWRPDNQDVSGLVLAGRGLLVAAFVGLSAIIAWVCTRSRSTAAGAGALTFNTWLKLMALFWTITLTFYTGLFTNVQGGFFSGIVGSLGYWLTQQEVARAGQPWFYYSILASLYEFLPATLAGAAVAGVLRRRRGGSADRPGRDTPIDRVFIGFIIWWAIGSLILFAWAGERMPWLLTHQLLPVCLLAAVALDRLVDPIASSYKSADSLLLVFASAAAIVLVVTLLRASPFAGDSVAATALTAAWVVRALLLATLAAFIVRWLPTIGWRSTGRLAALGAVVVLAVLTLRTMVQLNFVRYDLASEPMSYAQASPDVRNVVEMIAAVSERAAGQRPVEVAFDDESTWPLLWYFRDYSHARTWGSDAALARSASIILVGPKNRAALAPYVASGYVGERAFLYWWPLQDYANLTVHQLWTSLWQPSFREHVWRVFFYRDYGVSLREWPLRREFDVYVREDIDRGGTRAWGRAIGPPLTASSGDEVLIQPEQVVAGPFGGTTLRTPTGVTVAADGARVIADSGNDRIVVLERDGTLRRLIGNGKCVLENGKAGCVDPDGPGRFSAGDGQMNEPWGAIEGSNGAVFVADTWNGRVQVFDQKGAFQRSWGAFGQPSETTRAAGETRLYGPRGLAFDSAGRLVVADTGNKRLVVFDATGDTVSEIGSGTASGERFDEPTAVVLDPNGTLLVADSWNQRIVRLDTLGRTLSAWPVAEWESRTPEHKPFVAVDAAGFVYATAPQGGLILVFTPAGKPVRRLRIAMAGGSNAQPTGVAVDLTQNKLLVVDRAGGRLISLPIASRY
jgi:uncharacterized protein (TIGR03663 family)